ncbi:MAG TPA: GNAT family N-acetyltransferase [Candidatus Eremiobacteraceae bacterium]|nr:GNAT family N-acetyltransferase [Candidatus Eremiobacteraceae bacterium]
MIRSERLRLRRLEQCDFDELFALFQDPLVMRYYPALKSRAETQAWLDWVFAAYASHGHGLFAVERASDGVFLGQCGLIPQQVEGEEFVELGYLFKSRHWHRGYATEAASGCRDHGFRDLGLPKLVSFIRPENAPSRAVAERVGMRVERSFVKRGIPHLIYSIEKKP